ncbi:aspartate/glutamate racemase family protein [Rhodoferax saidenbachensis]|uniref:Asp/Glu racemase n=1 Tax=Rhodoferax saidenbachensis TaxID=1484693 RepID=A0A1P8KD98_9BURK|nr:aspartate/glutamate racemase family protein [Rhodoferax saidenbachensis]APW43981.1 Asp/Glu racemase [Rhodoferax saidenbachensis]
MRELLILNPNTSHSVSDLLQTHAQAIVGPEVHVRTVTARFGAPYIACEASYAVAAHAALDIWAAAMVDRKSPPDAVLVGCFGDPGLLALRETSLAPVTGLAEAAFIEAAQHGRFAIVTGGERWKPMLTRLAQTLGFGAALAGIHTVVPTGAQLAQDPVAAQALLARACQQAAQAFDVQAIILGGAGLAGMAAAIQAAMPLPLIDSVGAGVRQAVRAMGQVVPHATGRFDASWRNLSPEMTAMGLP